MVYDYRKIKTLKENVMFMCSIYSMITGLQNQAQYFGTYIPYFIYRSTLLGYWKCLLVS